jgi:hypothetical protein
MAQDAAAQVLDEEVRGLSVEDRQAARAKIADLLRDPPRTSRRRPAPRKKRTKH